MIVEYTPLLTLQIVHAYYGGACSDFEFVIPSGTQRLLAGGRLLAKAGAGRLTVLFQQDTDGSPVQTLPGATLQFGMRLINPHFANFTELPLQPGEGLPLYRNAGADATKLQAPVALLLDPAHEDDAELVRAGLFALVEAEIEEGFYAAAPDFQVGFSARAETLKYYVVASNYSAGEFNQIEVSDAGFTADARPQIDFDRVAASGFAADDIPPATLGESDARIAMFRSQQPVARQQKARSRIQLARNSDIIIPQLPQPGAAAASASLIVHLSK